MVAIILLFAVSASYASLCEEAAARSLVDGSAVEIYQNGFMAEQDISGQYHVYNAEGKKILSEKNVKIYQNGLVVTRDASGYSTVYNSDGKKMVTEKEVELHENGIIIARTITNIFTIYNIEGEQIASGRTEAQKIRKTKKEPVAKTCKEKPKGRRLQHGR